MSNNKISSQDSPKSIIKSTSIMSLGTLSSRILGFLRDIVLATLLGTAAMADAFFVAFRIPNLFRDLVGEGATNSAFVPVLAQFVEKKDHQELQKFISVMFAWAIGILGLITIIGVLASPVIVRLIAPGFVGDPEKLATTIQLTQWMFPYLILIGLTAYCMGILVTLRSFATPAFGPCLLNVALIVAAVIAMQMQFEPVHALAIGVLIGGLLQLGFQLAPLFKKGIRLTWPKIFMHEGAKRVGKLLIPRMWGSAVYQSTVFVDTFCASLASIVGIGGISAIYYANRIVQFPLAVFGIAMAMAVLPTMSGLAANDDKEKLKETVVFSLENVLFILIPASVFLILLAQPLIQVLFERGEFDSYSTQITSWALMFYAFGLASYGGIKILVTTFHSLQDTATPVKVAALCLVINLGLNFILMFPLKIGGIALASSIAATIDFLILFFILEKRFGGGMIKPLLMYLFKLGVAASLMAAMVWYLWQSAIHFAFIGRLIICGIFGSMTYFALCSMMQLPQALHIKKWAKEQLKRN